MRKKSVFPILVVLVLLCFSQTSCEVVEKVVSAAETGLEYKKKLDEEKQKWNSEESKILETGRSSDHGSGTTSQFPKLSNKKGGQNSPTTLGPNESKKATINGGNTSLSNRMADYTVTVTGCRGSKSDQTVTVYFTVLHGLADQYFAIRASHSKAFAGGMSYSKFATKVGGKSSNNTVPYQVEISCEATIKYVPPSVQVFESISVDLYSKNKGGNSGTKAGKLELRDLKVVWQ